MVGKAMAKEVRKLSARGAATITKPGRHSDGGGLYLNVTETGARSWVFMWKVAGRRREMGLGSARDVPLARARELAAECRAIVSSWTRSVASARGGESRGAEWSRRSASARTNSSWRSNRNGATRSIARNGR